MRGCAVILLIIMITTMLSFVISILTANDLQIINDKLNTDNDCIFVDGTKYCKVGDENER